jgi:hypothetical protein
LKHPLTAVCLCGILAAGLSGQALAQSGDEPLKGNEAYVVDSQGYVWRNQFGDCWRTQHWT